MDFIIESGWRLAAGNWRRQVLVIVCIVQILNVYKKIQL
jgi:hypothetical protein